MSPQESQALLAGAPVLSEPRINTAGDGGNGTCKQPFGLEENSQLRFLIVSCGQLLLHQLSAGCLSLSLLSWESRAQESHRARLWPLGLSRPQKHLDFTSRA